MGRQNRLTNSIVPFFIVGAIVGALAGLLVNVMSTKAPTTQYEARVLLFRVPGDGTFHAARDYLSYAISRPGFFETFAQQHGIDANDQALIARNLGVTARDPSSQNAELRLIGKDEAMLTSTLDALAIHLTESLRTIDEADKDLVLSRLEKEIDLANEKNRTLFDARRKGASLSGELKKEIRIAGKLAAKRKELELSQRYFLKPLTKSTEEATRYELNKVIKAQAQHERRINNLSHTDSDVFKYAKSVALNEANLKALTQAKQRLVIEFNKDTPLRIASRAKATPFLVIEPQPVGRIIGICAFIGLLVGGVVWSILRTRESKLTGLEIERRMGVPTAAVISQRSTDLGIEQGQPLARTEPQSEDLAGIRSLLVAACFLNDDGERNLPWVFTELGKGNHVGHVIANLALIMASRRARVLVIEASPKSTELSALFERGADQGWVKLVTAEDLSAGRLANGVVNRGRISYCHEQGRAVTFEDMANFDCVLVHAKNASDAKNRLADFEQGVGLVLCTAATRISMLRKALGRSLGKKMHGVVLCGDSN